VLVVCFEDETLQRDCCDGARMRHRWGPERARRISRRLRQLEAMNSLDDLKFMPFDSDEHRDGVFEIAVDAGVSLFMQRVEQPEEDGPVPNTTVTISRVGARSIAVP